MRTLTMLKGMARRSVTETIRYSFELLSGIVVLYLVFVLLFFGARGLIGDGAVAGDTLSAFVVGYVVWVLAILAYSETANVVTQEATQGTLEQLAMTPFGLPLVLIVRFVAGLLVQSVLLVVMLVLAMATSGRWLHLDVVSLLPLFLLTLAGVFGVGIAVSGLAVVFKRVQSFVQILQFVFVALIAAPIDRFPAVKYLPLAWGNELIGRVMIHGTPLWGMPAGDLLFGVLHAGAWIAGGVLVFQLLERVARDRALLGQY